MSRNTTSLGFSFCLALAMASCSDHHGSDGMDGVHRQLQELTAESTRHHTAVMDLESIADLPEEAERHGRRMNDSMAHMDNAMMRMGHCQGPGMGEMRSHMHGMDAAVEEHLDNLEQAPDVASAHEACLSHTEAMQSRLEQMDEALGRAGCM